MATFNLTITYPDGQGAKIIAALKARYSVTTNAEAIEKYRLECARLLIDIVHDREFQTALNGLTPVSVT